jgi:ATP-binding cassette, subfamily B, bacterial
MEEKREITYNKQMSEPRSIFALLKDYKLLIAGSLFLSILVNALNLLMPQLIRRGIDDFTGGTLVLSSLTIIFAVLSLAVLIIMYGEALMQNYVGEKVARELRSRLSDKIAREPYSFIEKETPGKLLTNLTSDVDAIKMFVSQASVLIIVSVFTIIAASILLIFINWKLALWVLLILPLIGGAFFVAFSKMGPLFGKSQGIIDRLNTVISGSVLGAALVRVVNGGRFELEKFAVANTEARDTGLAILKLFASLIPIVMFVSNLSSLVILGLGGYYVIGGTMSLGDFAAFQSYIVILIFPVFIIGFMSSVIGRAQASYVRVQSVLFAETKEDVGTVQKKIAGNIEIKNVELELGGKPILKNISCTIQAGTKTAIIGPTAAGKTQLMYALVGLVTPNNGEVVYDGTTLGDYDKASLYSQVGFVFQDSVMFNLSLRENIAFSKLVTDESLRLAVETAELGDFMNTLPDGLDTIISERGTTLSGGQKQRVMLARALALNPAVLLLDDFTARVDTQTEQKIIDNIARNYPQVTLVSVTQKIASAVQYDQIILLMEGEIMASGMHEHLLHTSPEYVQMFESQHSTTNYELPS